MTEVVDRRSKEPRDPPSKLYAGSPDSKATPLGYSWVNRRTGRERRVRRLGKKREGREGMEKKESYVTTSSLHSNPGLATASIDSAAIEDRLQ
jgi:hypothetical protein